MKPTIDRIETSKQLAIELDESRIAERKEGWGAVSYLETWDVIQWANSIFGFFGWEYYLDKLQVAWEGETQRKKGTAFEVHYLAEVTLNVDGISRGNVGYGSGLSYSNPGEAHELAAKEAVSDALKRCFRTWGSKFGNTLYDKKRTNKGNGGNGSDKPATVDETLGI